MVDHYIGIMSGTSLDGVDAVLASFDDGRVRVLDCIAMALPAPLRDEAIDLIDADADSLNRSHRLGNHLTALYARAVAEIQRRHTDVAIAAVGCHGQTLRHFPGDRDSPFTVQVVNGAMLAVTTGIPCVTDFRRADMALGGQGAPLAPAFHDACLRSSRESRVILNLGGIANVTLLPADATAAVVGFDTGPANALMDDWVRHCTGERFDAGGALAARGRCHRPLLTALLRDVYFAQPPPKSTGRETFGTRWLRERLAEFPGLDVADVQATLVELTAQTVTDAIERHFDSADAVYACGGGCRNPVLMARLADRLGSRRLSTTADLGVAPDWVEATAFAWLAFRRLEGLPGNLPSVTGASRAAVLGGLYLP